MLNTDNIHDYLKTARLTMIAKNGKTNVQLDDIRPIAILPHITKVIEKAIKTKIEQTSDMFKVEKYQTGFQKGSSTA